MNKRRIIFTALIGTIALTALSVSISLAWYGASDRLGVHSLDVKVSTAADLRISTSDDLSTFKNKLGMDDFSSDDKNIMFTPTSSMFQNEWFDKTGANRVSQPVFYDSSSPLVPSSGVPYLEESTYGFFRKDIFLLTDFDFYVSLEVEQGEGKEPCSFESNTEYNEQLANDLYNKYGSDWQLTEKEIEDKLNNLINCLRVSILVLDETEYNYFIVDPTKQENDHTYYGGRLDNNRDGYYDTYEAPVGNSSVDKEVIYGEVNDRSLIKYDDPLHDKGESEQGHQTSEKPYFFGNSFLAESKDTAATYNEQASIENGLEFVEEPSLSLADIEESNKSITENDGSKPNLLIPCYARKPSHIVLSIYLEGWDLDCINATMGASFKINLNFKLLRRISIDG